MCAALALQRRRRRGEVDLTTFTRQGDLLAGRLAAARDDRAHQGGERLQVLAGQHLLDRHADDRGLDLEQPRRGGVDSADPAVRRRSR